MKLIEISRWLKMITIAIAMMGALFFFWIVPVLAGEMKFMYPEVAFLYWPGLLYGWLIAIICYVILFQFWKICREIGKDNSFSIENANSFKIMSKFAAFMAAIWFIGLVVLTIKNWMQAGIMLFMIFAVFASIVISICAAALSHLVLKAYELKQENEYTI